jgi:HK97 gp10 family phage protein
VKTKITTTGFGSIDELLKKLPGELTEKLLTQAHRAGGRLLLDAVRRNTPIGTVVRKYYGKSYVPLRESWAMVSVRRGVTKGEVLVGPRKKAPYKGWIAHMLEFGTKKMPAKPMMMPAYQETKGLMVDTIRLQIGRKVLGTMKRTLKNDKKQIK